MKSHKFIYISLLGIILVFGIFVLYQRLQAQKAFNAFLKEAHLKQSDIVYQSREKPFMKEGLILYGVVFPQLKIEHKIRKMIIRKEEEKIILRLQGFQINLPQALNACYGNDFINALKVYKPFEDALRKPLISLGLIGVDTLKGDIVLIFNPQHAVPIINTRISLPQLAEIQLSFRVEPKLDSGYRKNLIYLFYGSVPEINADIQDIGLFKAYANYLNSIGTADAKAYAKELMRHSGFTRYVKYTLPPLLAQFYYSFSKEY